MARELSISGMAEDASTLIPLVEARARVRAGALPGAQHAE